MHLEKELTAKIQKITMTIRNEFPELSMYLEEMPVAFSEEKNPAVTEKKLKAYYDSLISMLSKYISEHPDMQKSKYK